ncbi:MAG: amidohydrolase family protein [Desulfobacteraceae bacterium]|jgi:imidazolonepropionase-like amidohydrolase
MTSENIEIRSGWLVDGSGSTARKDCLINLSEEKIFSVIEITPGTELPSDYIDFSDCTIIPGLVDSHTHLTISGTLDPETRNTQINDEYHTAELRIKNHIRDYLKHGVVAVRDGGDFHAHALKYKNEFHSLKDTPIAIYTAGNGYHVKGRYGQLLGMYLEPGRELAQAILEDFRQGIDHIKIVNSGVNSLTEFGRETSPQFSKEELKRAVEGAASIDLKIMVHANGKLPVQLAIEAGCHSIEHGYFMGEDNLKRMADNGTIWVPTIIPMKAYMDISDPESLEYKIAEKNMNHQLEQVEKAVEYGVTIALGTDAGSPGVYHGSAIVEEFRLLLRAGLSVEQVVKYTTSNAMQIIDDKTNNGAISEGMPATFVVTKGCPDDLPESLKSIKEVWVKGRKV